MSIRRIGTRGAAARVGIVGVALTSAVALGACSSNSSSGGSSPSASASVSVDPALAAKVPADIKSTGKLIYGTDASYAPNEFLGEDGSTIQGFDVDLGNATAAKLGLTGNFVNATFGTIITGVNKGKFNAGMSSFSITDERMKQVNMVSYFNAGTAWAAKSGNPSGITPENACGKTVAVQKDTVQVEDLEKRSTACKNANKGEITLQQYSLQSEATTALVSSKVDAMAADSPVIAYAIKQSGQIQQVGEVYDSAPYGIAIAKNATGTEFAPVVQAAINALIADGTYKQILDKWGVANGAVKESKLNSTTG